MFIKNHSGKNAGYLSRTLLSTVSLLKDTVSNEKIAARPGFLQKSDPRIKCLSAVLLLLCVLVTKSTSVLLVLYISTIVLAALSSIKLSFYLKRTL